MLTRRTVFGLFGAASLAALAGCTSTTPASGGGALSDTLDVSAFAGLVATPQVVVIDVRTPAEYAEGHLEDAQLLDISDPGFASKVAQLDTSKTYAVYCRSGNRSATALQAMKQAGFSQVHHLGPGINAWKAAGKLVVR